MKALTLLTILIISITGLYCTTEKRLYYIPENYTGKTRDNMDKMLMRGQKLFKAHCSGCHGIFTKGKDSIPNFSKTQIEAYEARLLYDDQANHGILQKITSEELDRILDFLKLRTIKKDEL
ncbi:MAG TPA: c-type cytochrome [Chitinophagaceae bacterium]|nr:c-type cytochrome [Chitinophagaceae bacterium]